jgi:hypothetical protein
MLRKHLPVISIVSLLITFSLNTAFAAVEGSKPASLWDRIVGEVAKKEIGGTVNLVSAEILNGLSTSLQYRISSEPSYVGGYYTRIDKYTLNFDLNPGDFIEAFDFPVGMNIHKGSEIFFARQFKSQAESLVALPYTPLNLPFTAENALKRLQPGDFVAFQADLSFIVTVSHDFLKGVFEAGASTHAYLSGEFIVHVFRMADNKIRVKLIASRGRGVGANAGVDLGKDINVIGIRYLTEAVDRLINLQPLRLSASARKNDVIMLDYIFNLNIPEAAEAYNTLMLHKVQLKDVRIVNPTKSTKDLTEELLTDLTGIEKLTAEDAAIPQVDRRIDRVFKGSLEGFSRDASLKFGFNLWKFEAGRAYAENNVLSFDKENNQQQFRLDTLSRYKKTKILFGLFGEETLFTSNLLFTSDKNWKPKRFVTLSTSAEMRIKQVNVKDFQEIQRIILETIGETEFNKIEWLNWSGFSTDRKNGYFKQEVFFNPEALQTLPQMSANDIAKKFRDYVELKGRPRSRPFFGGNGIWDYILPWINSFTGDIDRVASHLEVVVTPTKTIDDRFVAFESLQKIPIWKERGMGFLISLLPADRQTELLRYDMTLSAKDMPTISFTYGSFAEEQLYRALIYIQNIINNRSFDLRQYTDGKGTFTSAPAPIPFK